MVASGWNHVKYNDRMGHFLNTKQKIYVSCTYDTIPCCKRIEKFDTTFDF